jgi:hypothetical protein
VQFGCAEDLRLRQAYEAALRRPPEFWWIVFRTAAAWNLSHPSFINGFYSIDASSRLRREFLSARWKAADDLYDHSVRCPNCKMSKILLLEDE